MAHILIVEDEKIIRSALRRLLERNQFRVSEAGSVQEAQDLYDVPSFDLVISDLRLPGAPGTEMIDLAKGKPVLIMTSYASLRSAVDSMKQGAVDYIAKPFDHDEMLQAVARILVEREQRPAAVAEESVAPPPATGEIGIIGNCAPSSRQKQRIWPCKTLERNVTRHPQPLYFVPFSKHAILNNHITRQCLPRPHQTRSVIAKPITSRFDQSPVDHPNRP